MQRTPDDLDRAFIDVLLDEVSSVRDVASRTGRISERFLGSAYRDNPLAGSTDRREVMRVALTGFDCVTYVESVLALARSRDATEFVDNLRRIRYAEGVVDFKMRNHYMTDWIRRNGRMGFVSNQTRGDGLIERERRLNVVEGLPETTVKVRSIPKAAFMRRQADVRSGDLAFFASTRRNLDVFHCGILVGAPGRWRLRHAARSRGQVVEEALEGFLRRNRMSGVILVRPKEPYPRAA